MGKPNFKVVDDKGRVVIPKALRASLGIDNGDIVSMTAEKGKINIKKAIVLDDANMPMAAKECYAQSLVREFDSGALADLMGLAAKRLKEIEDDKSPF